MKATASNTSPTRVARTIRRFVNEQGLKPGDPLPRHTELQDMLGVGARPLREGLSILRHEGFVVTKYRQGTFVGEPRIDRLCESIDWHLHASGCTREQLVVARARFESVSAAEAARVRKARDLLVILDAVERLRAVETDGGSSSEAEQKFHLAVLSATHNPLMIMFGKLVSLELQRLGGDVLPDWVTSQANEEHAAIYTAIEAQDSEGAMRIMWDHVMRNLRVLRAGREHRTLNIEHPTSNEAVSGSRAR